MQMETDRSKENQPTKWNSVIFGAKAWLHRIRRVSKELGRRPKKLGRCPLSKESPLLAESATALFSTGNEAEFALQAGKVQNLRVIAAHLNGLVVPAGTVFSFWANIPRPTAGRGFAPGRELREGCIIPSIGGGLCQLTNSLYDAALTAGFEILERHAHSRRLPGSMAEQNRDATVFWNYVDLRFRAPVDIQIEVRLSRWKLTVAYRRLDGKTTPPVCGTVPASGPDAGPEAESCETCGVTSCFRNPSATSLPKRSATTWLVDSFWPEHDSYLSANRTQSDTLLMPLNSRKYGIGPYRWNAGGFSKVVQFPLFTARRSFHSRKLAEQGPVRQRALLKMDDELAKLYAQNVPYSSLHLVVSQTLLPFLWQRGVLGGRSFEVLMTRLPLAHIQSQLDSAAAAWPEARMLTDFRADPELIEAETEALAAADCWITPHQHVASLAPKRVTLLDWKLPAATSQGKGRRVIFPASTLARKGAWELRKAARDTLIPITLGGPILEGRDFWSGCNTIPSDRGDWLRDAALVVLPSWVENQPRRLLKAIAAGIPVIATEACGIAGLHGVTTIPNGDSGALGQAIDSALAI